MLGGWGHPGRIKEEISKSKVKFAHTLISHSPISFSSDVNFCGAGQIIIDLCMMEKDSLIGLNLSSKALSHTHTHTHTQTKTLEQKRSVPEHYYGQWGFSKFKKRHFAIMFINQGKLYYLFVV